MLAAVDNQMYHIVFKIPAELLRGMSGATSTLDLSEVLRV
jgi:hypothetical protein